MRRRIAGAVLATLALLMIAVILLLSTTAGARIALRWIAAATGGELHITSMSGRLLGPLALNGASFRGSGQFKLDLDHLSLRWQPAALLRGRLLVDDLTLDELSIDLPPGGDNTQTVWPPKLPAMPLPIQVKQARINGLSLHRQSTTTRLDQLSLAGTADKQAVHIERFALAGEELAATLSGNMEMQGDYPLRAKLDWSVRTPDKSMLKGSGTIGGDLRRLQLEQTLEKPQQVTLKAALALDQPQLSADIDAAWDALQWPIQGKPQWNAAHGKLHLRGNLDAYTMTLKSHLEGPNLPAASIDIEGRGDSEHLNTDKLLLQLLGGRIDGSGRLDWGKVLGFDLDLNGADLDPGKEWASWDGKLAFGGRASGKRAGDGWQFNAHIARLEGVTHGKALQGNADLELMGDTLTIPRLALDIGGSKLAAHGTVNRQFNLQGTLDSLDMGDWLPGAQGHAKASLRIEGARDTPRIIGSIQAGSLAYEDQQVDTLNLSLNLDLAARDSSHIQLNAGGLKLAEQTWDSFSIKGDGPLGQHQLQARLIGAAERINLALAGGLQGALAEGVWHGQLTRLDIESKSFGQWALQHPAKIGLSKQSGTLGQACLQSSPDAKVCGDGHWNADEGWQANAALQNLPLSDLPLQLPPDSQLQGKLNGKLNADQRDGDIHAILEMKPTLGVLRVHPAGQPGKVLTYHDAVLQAKLDGQRLQASLHLALGEPSAKPEQLHGEFSLYPIAPDKSPLDARLAGRLRANLDPAGLLSAWMPELSSAEGGMNLDLMLGGSAARPLIQGSAKLSESDIALPPVGISLKQLQLDFRGAADGRIQVTGMASSGDGQLQLNGEITPDASQGWPFTARVQGKDFLATDIPEARVLVSPDINLDYRERHLHVSGSLDIPRALVSLPKLPPDAVMASPDVVVVSAQEASPKGGNLQQQLSADVNLSIGDNEVSLSPECKDLSREPLPKDCPGLLFEGQGLRALLTGNLRLSEILKQDLQANGILRVSSGIFSAYGEQLQLSEGRLLFSGSPSAPTIYALAERQIADVTAGLKLTGPVSKLNAEIYSKPTMSQMQALSYLLLGKPLDSASGDQANLLSSAALALGNKLLANPTGLSISSQGTDAEGNPDLAVGKYLSSRLYLGYGLDLYDHSAGVKIIYQLSRRLTLHLQGGERGSADVAYQIEWD